MLFVMRLRNSLHSKDTSPTVQYIPASLSTQPSEQALPELGIMQWKVIEGSWVKQALSNLFSLNFPHTPGLSHSPLL